MDGVSDTASQLVYEFQPTTPHGTLQSAPHVESFTMPPLEVQWIQWVVPPGPQGNLGWQITCSGEVVIPQNGAWIVTDNEKNSWELDEQITSGSWGFRGYNSGQYDHTVYLRFLLNPLPSTEGVGSPAGGLLLPIGNEDLGLLPNLLVDVSAPDTL
jgi:hypothetical protein